jgi:hypothetical protein
LPENRLLQTFVRLGELAPMVEIDLDSLSKDIAKMLMDKAASEMATRTADEYIQERADELFMEMDFQLEPRALEAARRRANIEIESRADIIVTQKADEILKRANELAKEKIEDLAEPLAYEIAFEKAKVYAKARAEAILEESDARVQEFTVAFVRECAIRAFLMENEDELHSWASKIWAGAPKFRTI